MAKRTGASHSLGALVGLLAGGLLVEYLKPRFPAVCEPVEGLAVRGCEALQAATGLSVPSGLIAPLLVAMTIAFVWGVGYHTMRFGVREGR